jgi:hypothetical protein
VSAPRLTPEQVAEAFGAKRLVIVIEKPDGSLSISCVCATPSERIGMVESARALFRADLIQAYRNSPALKPEEQASPAPEGGTG